ncbi:hypothetical protein SS1G_10966 [Sclerotinia sclerotiorum 1980 UF-70]|uniref:ubiquitinyl hydrolase 1 n=1 Tax=Sclerotinia sclerotiorum (strain ATCC 18683 / 1980 / Ss-1) TaxID=665079 RepID=A7F049_SCLS1|nr:hypothetical protein SS1G_10966 [Sclerotinia sclerotiorum 1980 UF-70]EDN95091.1 hypothetical protein SS1G_10966 [Sclerotinia sclerotiorum 1980 UF-70]
MDAPSVSGDYSVQSTVSDFAPRKRSLRNQRRSGSPSGVSTHLRENVMGAQEVQNGQISASPGTGRPKRSAQRIKRSEAGIIDDTLKPLTDEERRAWKGWCELESDPALFNFILREYGVKDVKVQEVLGLEDEMLQYLPYEIYPQMLEIHIDTSQENQYNACATIALLNIIMNVPGLDLGDIVSNFKSDTQFLKPAYRGQKLSQNEYIRNIHNTFARRMDILNADLALSNEVSAWENKKKTKKKSGKTRSRSDDESGFHFIAFVPVKGVVWRLDGLQRQPVSLGQFDNDWISVARANIYQHIGKYGDDLQFNLLSLCGSPLRAIPLELAQNIHAIKLVEALLPQQTPDSNSYAQTNVVGLIRGPSEEFGVTDKLLQEIVLPLSTCNILERGGTDATALFKLHQQWVAEQKVLRIAYRNELSSIKDENEQADRRKEDHTPTVYRTLRSLADKGLLKEIMEEVQST